MKSTNALNYTSAKTFDLIQVTPKIAAEYLSANIDNYRTLKPTKVAAYARDMANGRWHFTGDPLVFDWNGVLRQGQHRLNAVVESGATIQFLVIRGVDPQAQDVMDSGLARTAADALGHHGFKNNQAIAATFNVVYCYENGLYKNAMSMPDSKAKLTVAEIVEAAQARPDLVEAAQVAVRLKHAVRLPVGALALSWSVLNDIDTDDAKEFFERIENMQTGGKGDPLYTFMRRVGEYRDRREQIRPATALFFLFRTWNAYRRNEELTRLLIGSAESGWVKIPQPK